MIKKPLAKQVAFLLDNFSLWKSVLIFKEVLVIPDVGEYTAVKGITHL